MINCACKNCETCKCSPVFDVNELRDKVRKLKTCKAELVQTANNLTQEIEVKSLKLREARHNRIQVDPDPDLRLRLADTASVLNDKEDIDSEKFRIANEKLEMQILIQEIRSALPQLERDVRWRESIAASSKKSSSKISKAVEKSETLMPLIWCTTDEIRQRLNDAIELAISSKKERATAIENQKRRNIESSELVAGRRKELAKILRTRDHLLDVVSQVDHQWRTERFRRQLLREEHLAQREALRKFHDGYGFQTEAFLLEAGEDPSATLSIQRTLAALRPWLLPADEAIYKGQKQGDPSASWLTEDIIVEQLQQMQRGEPSQPHSNSRKQLHIPNGRVSVGSLDLFQYYEQEQTTTGNGEEKSTSLMMTSEDKPVEDAKPISEDKEDREERRKFFRETKIDIKTFCLLFDRLIIVYDA